jgi:plastocyanin
MKSLSRIFGVAAIAAVLGSCGGGSSTGTKDVCISATFCATDFAFTPASAARAQGATVVWGNNGASAHNVTFDNAAAASAAGLSGGNIAVGDIFTQTITVKGTYAFHCAFHPQMTGTISIQ